MIDRTGLKSVFDIDLTFTPSGATGPSTAGGAATHDSNPMASSLSRPAGAARPKLEPIAHPEVPSSISGTADAALGFVGRVGGGVVAWGLNSSCYSRCSRGLG